MIMWRNVAYLIQQLNWREIDHLTERCEIWKIIFNVKVPQSIK
jgi:hypothetical protein